jgi:hypothetical protein
MLEAQTKALEQLILAHNVDRHGRLLTSRCHSFNCLVGWYEDTLIGMTDKEARGCGTSFRSRNSSRNSCAGLAGFPRAHLALATGASLILIVVGLMHVDPRIGQAALCQSGGV